MAQYYRENSSKNYKRHLSKRRRNNSLALIIFTFLLIYLIGYLIQFLLKPSIGVENVNYGSIEVPFVLNGLIVRDEYVEKSTMTGQANYIYAENDKVKKDAVVCTIKNIEQTDNIEGKIEDINENILSIQQNRRDISIFQEDINKVENQIKNIIDNYSYKFINDNISDLYSFKNQVNSQITIRNNIWLTENTKSISTLTEEKNLYQSRLDDNMVSITAKQSGILSLRVDNYEDLLTIENLDKIIKEQTSKKIIPNFISKTTAVNENDAIFKIICSNDWYIVSYIPLSITGSWEEKDSFILTTSINEEEKNINVYIDNIREENGESRVVFKCSQDMADFLDARTIEFKVKSDSFEGLKIPNEAIVEKTLLKIPSECLMENGRDNGVLKKNGNITEFVPVVISKQVSGVNEEGYIYVTQDFKTLKTGDIILKGTDENAEDFTISDVETSKGVYVVNTSIAKFTSIEILGSNEDYSIVKPGNSNYGLQAYDTIVSDAMTVEDSESIY